MLPPGTDGGSRAGSTLLQSLKGYLASWVDLLRTRIDLLSTELQEEQHRIQETLLLAATSLLCLSIAALLVTFFLVVLFWETRWRLVVVGGLALIYLAAGLWCGAITRRKSRERPKLLGATVNELSKDLQHLSS